MPAAVDIVFLKGNSDAGSSRYCLPKGQSLRDIKSEDIFNKFPVSY